MHSNTVSNGRNSDITERDAAHIRFRERGPIELYRCSSCYEYFEASNKLEVMEHFEKIVHKESTGNCLYCKGAVYQYRTASGEAKLYHNCLPFKKQNSNRKTSY